MAFNFQGEAKAVAHDGSIYDIVVEDESCGGWWRTSAFIGDEDAGDETLHPDDSDLGELGVVTSCASEGTPATATPWPTDSDPPTITPPSGGGGGSGGSWPSDPVTPIPTMTPSLPDPTLNVNVVESAFDDCWQVHISYYDPSASTTEISYDFTADGEDYSDTITFDEPIALFSDRIHQAKFDPDVNESDCQSGAEPPEVGDGNVSFVFEGGETGSLTFDQAQFEPEDTGIGPVVPGGDGEDGRTPWWVLAGVVGVGALGVRRFSPETFNAGAQAAREAATRAVAAAPGVVSALGQAAGRVASATASVLSRWRR